MSFGKMVRYVKLEAKTSNELEELVNEQATNLVPISFYASNGRHYAWFSAPIGTRKKVIKTKTSVVSTNTEKVKMPEGKE